MAAAAATATAALATCSKRESDIIGAGMSVLPPCLGAFLLRERAQLLCLRTLSSLAQLVRILHAAPSLIPLSVLPVCWLLLCCRPKKAKRGRAPPKEEVEAFLVAAESGLARRFAAK